MHRRLPKRNASIFTFLKLFTRIASTKIDPHLVSHLFPIQKFNYGPLNTGKILLQAPQVKLFMCGNIGFSKFSEEIFVETRSL